jgi:DNA-binding response OmpR family regulator
MKRVREGEKTILIAEKDAEVRRLLSDSLRLQGYEVLEMDRPGAIDVEGFSRVPDLFLLGHGPSDREALEALAAVRGAKGLEGVPIIMIAVEPDERFVVEAVSIGADSLLPFPFPIETLHERVSDLLQGRRIPMMP